MVTRKKVVCWCRLLLVTWQYLPCVWATSYTGTTAAQWTLYSGLKLSWNEASMFCKSLGGHLPVVNTKLKWNAFNATVVNWYKANLLVDDAWTGLFSPSPSAKPDSWEADCSLHPGGLDFWGPLEPNNLNTDMCVRIQLVIARLCTINCTSPYSVICEFDQGSCRTITGASSLLGPSLGTTRLGATTAAGCWDECLNYTTTGSGQECVAATFLLTVCTGYLGDTLLSPTNSTSQTPEAKTMFKECFRDNTTNIYNNYIFVDRNYIPRPAGDPCSTNMSSFVPVVPVPSNTTGVQTNMAQAAWSGQTTTSLLIDSSSLPLSTSTFNNTTLQTNGSTVQTYSSTLQTNSSTPHTSSSTVQTNSSNPQTNSTTLQTSSSSVRTNSSTAHTSSSTVQTNSSNPQTNSSTLQTNGSTLQTNGSTPQTNSSTLQTNGSTPQTNSSTLQTNGSTPQTNGSTPQTNSSTPQTSSSTVQINSSTPQTNGSIPQTNSSTLQTNGSTPQTSSSTVQTNSSTPQTSSSTVQTNSSTPQTNSSTLQTSSSTVQTNSSTLHSNSSTKSVPSSTQPAASSGLTSGTSRTTQSNEELTTNSDSNTAMDTSTTGPENVSTSTSSPKGLPPLLCPCIKSLPSSFASMETPIIRRSNTSKYRRNHNSEPGSPSAFTSTSSATFVIVVGVAGFLFIVCDINRLMTLCNKKTPKKGRETERVTSLVME